MLSVCVFSVIAAVTAIRNLLFHKKENCFAFALGAVFSFLFGAFVFLHLNAARITIRYGKEMGKVVIGFSTVSKTGIILTAVFTGVGMVLRFVGYMNDNPSKKSLACTVLSVLSVLSVLATAIFIGNVVIGIKHVESDYYMKISPSELEFIKMLSVSGITAPDVSKEHVFILIGSLVSAVASVGIFVFSVYKVIVSAKREKTVKKEIILSLIVFLLSVIFLLGYLLIMPNAKACEELVHSDVTIGIAGAIALVCVSFVSFILVLIRGAVLRDNNITDKI